jgi:DNA mismatch repair protein MutS
VAATEHRGKVVFLHEVREGPASKSYGLAVAQLAGVNVSVVKRARALLSQLEERAAGTRPQLDLFAAGAAPAAAAIEERDELRETLMQIDVDALTPRAALQLVYELKGLAQG